MDKELNKIIEDIKITLSNISSARQQVSNTVSAYTETQKEIKNYINEMNGIEQSVKELVLLLQKNKSSLDTQASTSILRFKETCNEIIESTKSNLSETVQSFSEKQDSNLRVMAKQVEDLDNSLKEASTLTGNVKEMSNEVSFLTSSLKALQQNFSNSKKEQDNVLNQINLGIKSLDENIDKDINLLQERIEQIKTGISKVKSEFDSIRGLLDKLFHDLTDNIDIAKNSINKEISSLKTIQQKISNTQERQEEILNKIDRDLKSQTEDINKNIDTLEDKITDEIKKNRYIEITIALIFIVFAIYHFFAI